jgi:glycosyltransferase involved in cell wall biosynthesis
VEQPGTANRRPGDSAGSIGRPIRVALVAPFGLRPKGTTGARVLPIARSLAAPGARVRVVIPPWDDPERAGQRWHEHGIDIVHTGAGGSPLGTVSILGQLVHEVRAFDPDVVHCFKPIGYSGALAYLLAASARRRNTPLVVVDADDLEGPSGWSGRRRLGIAGALRGAQETATLRRAPLVTVASNWLRQYVQTLDRPAETIRHLPNGQDVDGDEALPAPVEEREQGDPQAHPAPILLWYTRFTEAHPDRVVHLLARILAAIPDVRLIVVGEEINAGARAAFAAAAADAGLDNLVAWRGYETAALEEVLSPRTGGTVAIYPMDDDATNRARCPSKVPYLMARGVPIVAEAVGEVPSYLAGSEGECLVAPGDAEAFAAKVIRLLQDPQVRAQVSRRLHVAAARWRWAEVAGGLADWYRANLPSCSDPARS